MNLSPELQAEYDAMGLPWMCDQLNGIYCYAGEWDEETPLFDPSTDSVELLEFAKLAANEYHAKQQEIADLTAKVERLRGALDTIGGGHTSRFKGAPDPMNTASPLQFQSDMWAWSQRVAKEALKESEGA